MRLSSTPETRPRRVLYLSIYLSIYLWQAPARRVPQVRRGARASRVAPASEDMRLRLVASLLGASGLLLAAAGFLRSSSVHVCRADFAPVCGADGSTYGSACKARASGVGTYSDGACTSKAATSALTSAHAMTPTLTPKPMLAPTRMPTATPTPAPTPMPTLAPTSTLRLLDGCGWEPGALVAFSVTVAPAAGHFLSVGRDVVSDNPCWLHAVPLQVNYTSPSLSPSPNPSPSINSNPSPNASPNASPTLRSHCSRRSRRVPSSSWRLQRRGRAGRRATCCSDRSRVADCCGPSPRATRGLRGWCRRRARRRAQATWAYGGASILHPRPCSPQR